MKELSIAGLWRDYCKRIDLVESEVSEEQWKETKKAFYAACAYLLIMFRDNMQPLGVERSAKLLERITEELATFLEQLMSEPNN